MFLRKGGLPHQTGPGEPDVLPGAERVANARAARMLASSARACCCPAPPRVRVFLPLPSAPGLPEGEIDILLCAHHYRASARRLEQLGLAAFAMDGGAAQIFGPA